MMPDRYNYPHWFSPYTPPEQAACFVLDLKEPPKTIRVISDQVEVGENYVPLNFGQLQNYYNDGFELHLDTKDVGLDTEVPVIYGYKYKEMPNTNYEDQLAQHLKIKKECEAAQKEYPALLNKWKDEVEKEKYEQAKKDYETLKSKYEGK